MAKLDDELLISRRALLRRTAVAAGGLVGARLMAGPGKVLASTLPPVPGANETVSSLLPSGEECRQRVQRMVDFGPRLTGSPAHNRYIAWLEAQFTKYGCTMLPRDNYPVGYWHLKGTTPCSLKIMSGATPQTITITSYYPRSGRTGANGVTGPLVYLGAGPAPSLESSNPLTAPEAAELYERNLSSWLTAAIAGAGSSLRGSIAMIDLPLPLPLSVAAFLPLMTYYYPPEDLALAGTESYKRLWIAGGAGLEQLKEAGAVGVVFGFDASPQAMDGQYLPFSGSGPELPAVNVDRETAIRIRTLAAEKPTATLTLHAVSERVTTPSIVAVLPGDGSTDEVIVVNTHTDGQNFVEENGGVAQTLLARYFHRLPRAERLKRTLVFSAVTGHMAPGLPQTQGFIDAHPDIIEKTVAAITIEHFGTDEWLDPPSGYYDASRYEPAGCWSSTTEMVVPLIATIGEHEADKTAVLRGPVALGIGGPFFTKGIPAIGYLTGPNYLVQITANGGMDKLNADFYARQVAWFADLLTRYDKMSAEELRKGDAELYGA
ncbi:MAG TPA: hypothetical protein VHY83_07475 [Solirubrobacteraceae bacterium]|nr:hypothetical protein [Solirubrobacteraceae bacterium]